MILAVIGVVMPAGTLNMQDIVASQSQGEIFGIGVIGNPYIFTQFAGFLILVVRGAGGAGADAIRHADR